VVRHHYPPGRLPMLLRLSRLRLHRQARRLRAREASQHVDAALVHSACQQRGPSSLPSPVNRRRLSPRSRQRTTVGRLQFLRPPARQPGRPHRVPLGLPVAPLSQPSSPCQRLLLAAIQPPGFVNPASHPACLPRLIVVLLRLRLVQLRRYSRRSACPASLQPSLPPPTARHRPVSSTTVSSAVV